MRVIPLIDRSVLPTGERASLEAVVQRLPTLADVLRWARAQTPPLSVADIVTQDEYTHDVILEGGDRPYLVFDTT